MPINQKPTIRQAGESFFSLRRNFEWIDPFQEMLSLRAELIDLKDMKNRTMALPLLKKDAQKLALKFLEEVNHITVLRRCFEGWNGQSSPFNRLSEYGELIFPNTAIRRYSPAPSAEDVKKAFEGIQDTENAISLKEKEKVLAFISKRIPEIKARLAEIDPKYGNAYRQNGSDIRSAFLKQWTEFQKSCDSPCDPTGLDLRLSPKAEKKAYDRLNIKDFINRNSDFRPFIPPDKEATLNG